MLLPEVLQARIPIKAPWGLENRFFRMLIFRKPNLEKSEPFHLFSTSCLYKPRHKRQGKF